jgi:crotonobetainyl-CoA:carnitine CoA-transferase CaiB-like acyl-CoA transferase
LRRALSNVTAIEVTDGVAGSYCGKLLADLGADVWKVEPLTGDLLRHRSGPRDADGLCRSGAFLHFNTNKRSVVVDPTTPAGRSRLDRLLGRADLLVDDTGRGSAEWALGWDELRDRYPRLSVVRISPFGATGPYAGYRADDLVIQAMAGVLLRQGIEGQRPVRLPGELGSCFVGSMAALAALAAVVVQERTRTPSFVDLSAMEAFATVPMKQATLLAYEYRHHAPAVERSATVDGTLIPTGVFPCADGYMAMMSTPQQLGEMLDVLDDDNLRAAFARPDAFERGETKEALDAALYPWLLSHTRAECTAAAQKVGWPLAGVNSPTEVLEADHLHQRNFWLHADDRVAGAVDLPGPPHRLAEGGWCVRRLAPALGQDDAAADTPSPRALGRPAASGGPKAGDRPPLEGVRVIDMTTVWSGPYATMLLADLGAEVVRVENPWVLPPTTKGYSARPNLSNPGYLGSLYGPPGPGRTDRPWNRHAMNNSLARNKLSCTIDTRRAEGRELLMRLIETADVFIENFKASGLDHVGISVDEMRRRNPALVAVRMPPTGLSGDWSSYTGFGAQFDGLTGLLWLCGEPDEDLTMNPATTYMDASSGPAAAFATVAALRFRDATGRGQLVEFAQAENIVNHLGDVFVDCQLGVAPHKDGNRHRWHAPQGIYPCGGGGWVAVSAVVDEDWETLARAVGHPELATDPRFATLADRQAHHDELDTVLGAWTAARRADDAFHLLQRAGVPAGPVLDDAGFASDPQVVAREWLRPLESHDVGTHLHPGHAFRGVPQVWRRGSPVLGEDNEYVYKAILGVSDDEYERYRQEKMLADDYLDPHGEPY